MIKPVLPVSLNILDKEYRIACPEEDQEELIRSAQELDRQMRKVRDTGKVSGADRIAVLAALNLAHDVAHDLGSVAGTIPPDVCARVIDLRLRIENVLEKS
jgi:cell division protein ZapA